MAHHHSHSHAHSHSHLHNHKKQGKKLLWVTILNFSITIAQIIGGILSNSLSLISDAIHNLGDAIAILIAYVANILSKRKPNTKNTFGYNRFEILAAFFNALVLIGICIYLFYEAYYRFRNPEPIKGKLMLIVATFGLLANLISVLILRGDKKENINIKAAYLHLMGDTLSSVAVIIGGIFIWKYNILWVDPLITVLVGIYLIWHTIEVLQESAEILMQATPPHLNIEDIKSHIVQLEKIENIHHIHVWRLNDQRIFLEGHVKLTEDMRVSETNRINEEISLLLEEEFDIEHVTLHYEFEPIDSQELIIDDDPKSIHQKK